MNVIEEKTVFSVEECEVTLNRNGYLVDERHPEAKPGFPGKYMVYDPSDNEEGFLIVGDDRNSLIFEAIKYLDETLGSLQVVTISDEDVLAKDFGIVMESIGSVKIENGNDQYVLLTRKDGEPLTIEFAERWLLPRVFREGHNAGCYFCHNVKVMQKPFDENSCVCIIEHRQDI